MSDSASATGPAAEALRAAVGERMDAVDRALRDGADAADASAAWHEHFEALHILASAHGPRLDLHRKHVRRLAALARATRPAARLLALRTRLESLTVDDPTAPGRDWLHRQLTESLREAHGRLSAELPRRWKRTAGRMRRVLAKGRSASVSMPSLAAATVAASRPRLAELETALGRLHEADDRPHTLAARLAGRRLAVLWSVLPEADDLRTRLAPLTEALADAETLAALLDHIHETLPAVCAEDSRQRLDAALAGTAPTETGDRSAALVEFARAVHARSRQQFDQDLAPLTGASARHSLAPLAEALEHLEQDRRTQT